MSQELHSVLIEGGRILDPSTRLDRVGDILLENGKIAAIDAPGKIPASRAKTRFSAQGKLVVPGLIDVHVHLREPGFEHKETIATGTLAAVEGGFSSVACMANTSPVNDNPYTTAFIRERAREVAHCRVYPVGAVTKGLKGEELAEIGGMVEEGARAISDDGMPVMNSYLMRKAMEYSKAFGIPVISHAEDANLVAQGAMNEGLVSSVLGMKGNPAAAEEIMVAREISLCRLTGARLHIAHISTRLALDLVRRAKAEGLPVTAEVSPHHLTLTDESLHDYDTHCKMAPPLRTAEDVAALQKGLAEGVIDMIATDHAPHCGMDKDAELDQAANGITGLQTAVPLSLALVRNGVLSLERWVESLTSAPAKLLGLPLGSLKVGLGADVTVIDLDARWELTEQSNVSKSANSPFIGRKHIKSLQGKALAVFVGGVRKGVRS